MDLFSLNQGGWSSLSNPLDPSQERLVRIVATQGHQIAFQRGIFLLNGVQLPTDALKTDENHRIYKESIWEKDDEKVGDQGAK